MLREYQKDLIKSLRKKIKEGNNKVVAVMPTGAGKTFTFVHIVKGALDRGRKVLIITDRVELMKQAGGALSVYNMEPILLEAGSKPYLGGNLYTAMVETMFRRIKKKNYQHWAKQMDVVIIDECHMRAFDKLFPHFREDAKILGFTATPVRIGRNQQLGEYYEDLVVGVEIDYLIKEGFLSRPNYYGVETDLSGIGKKNGDFDQDQVAKRFSENKVYAGVAHNLRKYAPGKKTLAFCPSIASSIELCENLVVQGFNARHLDSTMNDQTRQSTLQWFNRTPDAVLCNVGILTKGFDEPSIHNVVLYRATQSLPLYLQMVGRGSRVIKGVKEQFNIFDFGGNIARHGFWHEPQPWSLEVLPEREGREGDAVLKQCKACRAFIPVRAIQCPECGHIHEKEAKEQELIELQRLDPWILRRRVEEMTLRQKVELCKAKVVKPYWVMHKVKTLQEAMDFGRMMGWSYWWFEHNYHRFWWAHEYLKAKAEGAIIINTLKKARA